MNSQMKRRGEAGVTLIEMLVVVSIIALFAALVGPRLFSNVDKARRTAALAQINSFMTAEIDGDRLTEEEIIANCIVTMVGGQETTTNLIGNGVLSLLRHPDQLQRLRDDLTLIPSAVEELLRYESPSQHTARIAPRAPSYTIRELGRS